MHVNFTLTIPTSVSTLSMPGTTRYYCHPVAWRSYDAISRHICPERLGHPVGRPVRATYHQAFRSGRVTCVRKLTHTSLTRSSSSHPPFDVTVPPFLFIANGKEKIPLPGSLFLHPHNPSEQVVWCESPNPKRESLKIHRSRIYLH